MDSQKPNNFENEWQKAFNDASFAPPSDMWERIEQGLERKKRRPFLFFLRPSAMLAGVAATLVLTLGGILFINPKDSKTSVAVVSESSEKVSLKPQKTKLQPNVNETNAENLASSTPSFANTNLSAANNNTKQAPALAQTNINKHINKSKKVTKHNQLHTLAAANFANSNTSNMAANIPPTNSQMAADKLHNKSIDNQLLIESISLARNENKAIIDLALLKRHDYKYLGSRYTLKRNKLVFEGEVTKAPVMAASDKSKFWLGVQSGISPFDPNMKLGGLNTVALAQADAFAISSNKPSMGASPSVGDPQANVLVSQPQNSIQSGIGINTGVAIGYKISREWNFESGIRYLRGNSTLNSNTYAFQQNGYVNTFLADYLLQNSANQELKVAGQVNTIVADASQFGNRYEYLMIPIQVGYEIGLSKKVALNLLAGVSTDIFLQNTIINDNSIVQEKSTINTSSNIYKPLNLSGLGGVRASYLISKHWQLNLGSSYQHSLFSGINTSTALQMHLKMFGLNYGLNYRF